MAIKHYSEEFRADAVELYRVTEGATVAAIAADLGIVAATLWAWLKASGVLVRGRRPRLEPSTDPGATTDELARLRARVWLNWRLAFLVERPRSVHRVRSADL